VQGQHEVLTPDLRRYYSIMHITTNSFKEWARRSPPAAINSGGALASKQGSTAHDYMKGDVAVE